MHKKKILFNIYTYGNIEALLNFYNKCLSYKDEYKNLKIKITGGFKLYNDNKIFHYLKRISSFIGKYDLVISDYPTRLFLRGRKSIFMSHGYGTKKTPGLDEIKNKKKLKVFSFLRENIDYIITLSNRDEEYFLKCKYFEKLPLPKYVPLGLPRNDILFNKNFIDSSKKEISEKYNLENKKIILYAPTWRGYKIANMFPFSRNNFENLDKYLEKHKWKLLYRPHYMEDIIVNQLINGLKNIIKIDFNDEPYTQKILASSDVLITDYSSIYIDFLILNRPIIFIPFDYEKYIRDRGLVIDFKDKSEIPGEKILSMNEMINYLQELEKGNDDYINWRLLARKKFYKYFDGKSCSRIWDFINKIINE